MALETFMDLLRTRIRHLPALSENEATARIEQALHSLRDLSLHGHELLPRTLDQSRRDQFAEIAAVSIRVVQDLALT